MIKIFDHLDDGVKNRLCAGLTENPVDPPASREQWAKCHSCKWTWIGFYLPQPLDVFNRQMKNITCPKCGETSKNIRMEQSTKP